MPVHSPIHYSCLHPLPCQLKWYYTTLSQAVTIAFRIELSTGRFLSTARHFGIPKSRNSRHPLVRGTLLFDSPSPYRADIMVLLYLCLSAKINYFGHGPLEQFAPQIRVFPMGPNLDVLIFVPALAGCVMAGILLVCFAAHHYLTILESTTVGGREVTWMRETFLEFFWKAWYLGWLLGLCYAPAYIGARLIAPGITERWLLVALALWVLFPIAQLSSLSAASPWYPLSLSALNRMARKPHLVLGFYLLSLPVLGLLAVAWYGSFQQMGSLSVALAAAFLLILGMFLYARLLGRLAYVLAVVKPLLERRRKKKPRPTPVDLPAAAQTSLNKALPPPPIADLPPIQTPLDGAISGYSLQEESRETSQAATSPHRLMAEIDEEEDSPPPGIPPYSQPEAGQSPGLSLFAPADAPRRRRAMSNPGQSTRTHRTSRKPAASLRSSYPQEEDDIPYPVQEPEVAAGQLAPPELMQPSLEEMRLRRHDDTPTVQRRLWSADLLTFLSQPQTLSAWLLSSTLAGVLVLLVRLARAFQPAVGD